LGLNLLSGVNVAWLTVVLVALSFLFILLNLNYSRFNLYKQRWLGGSLIIFILFLFGLISVIGHSELNKSNHFSKIPAQYLIVKISNEPVLKNGLLRFTARAEESIDKEKRLSASGTLFP